MKSEPRFKPRYQQLLKGQFFTPPAICDLMLTMAIQEGTERILEPGCGAGVFLLRAFEQLQVMFQRSEAEIASQLVGVELDEEALEQARLNWCNTASKQSLPTLFHTNFLSDAMDSLEPFDVVIGNPPYVRNEMVGQSQKLDKVQIRQYLLAKYQGYLERHPEQLALFSPKMDLYVWFCLQAATLLKPGGRLVFIVSNSWLNTSFGKAFQQFLLYQFKVCFLIESGCERWFPYVAVNSIILVLEKKAIEVLQEEPIQVIRLQEPVDKSSSGGLSSVYWNDLNDKTSLWKQLKVSLDSAVESHRFLPAVQLMDELQNKLNWAFQMRAPEPLLQMIQDNDWLTLGELGVVRYPIKTGINDFFFLTLAKAKEWRLSAQFLTPVVKSLRQVHQYVVQPEHCQTFLFTCNHSEKLLQERQEDGALSYIAWGETQQTRHRQKQAEPIAWPQVPSVKNRKPWYSMKRLQPAQLLCSRFWDQRFCFPVCQGDVLEDQTFYGLILDAEYDPQLIAGLLNSTLMWAVVEFSGRTNLGEGVLQFSRGDMATLPIPNPACYSSAEQLAIIQAFQALMNTPVKTIIEDVDLPERIALDRAVLEPLMDARQWMKVREQLKAGLLQRLQERRQMARRK